MDADEIRRQGKELADKLRHGAGEQVAQHEGKIKDTISKVVEFVNTRTDGKYADQVGKAASFVEHGVDRLAAEGRPEPEPEATSTAEGGKDAQAPGAQTPGTGASSAEGTPAAGTSAADTPSTDTPSTDTPSTGTPTTGHAAAGDEPRAERAAETDRDGGGTGAASGSDGEAGTGGDAPPTG